MHKINKYFIRPIDIAVEQAYIRIKECCNARLGLCLWVMKEIRIISLGGKTKASRVIDDDHELPKGRLFKWTEHSL